MPEDKLTMITMTQTCFAERVLREAGKVYKIPADMKEASAKKLVDIGKALPGGKPKSAKAADAAGPKEKIEKN